MKVAALKKNPNNPRQIKDANFERLKKSIAEFGAVMMPLRPIVYDETMTVLGGNMRLEACKALGMKEIPDDWVKRVEDLTDEEKRRFVIVDNNSFGEYDWDLLSAWDDLPLADWGVDIPEDWAQSAIDSSRSDDVEVDENKAEEFQKKWETASGQVWNVGTHKVLCGDATDRDALTKLLGKESPDCVFTDPPYDLDAMQWFDNVISAVPESCHCFVMWSDKRIVKLASNHIDLFRRFFAVDFRIANLVSNGMPMTRVDLIAEFLRGKGRMNNLKDGFTTLIECCKRHREDATENFGHVQAKNPKLPKIFIEHYSKPGEIVLDVFLGSGSTLIAAEATGRVCYGIELDPKMLACCLERANAYGLQCELVRAA